MHLLLLDEHLLSGRGLQVVSEQSSALGDDRGRLVVLLHDLGELFGFFGSLGVQVSQLRVQVR